MRETIGLLRRTLARLDVSSRSMYAIIEPGSCFAGMLFELALAADRSYMLALPEDEESPKIALDGLQLRTAAGGEWPQSPANAILRRRRQAAQNSKRTKASRLDRKQALELGLVTFAPDDLDWEDEVRIAIEERASLSPDALTGMEASLRFPGDETLETKVFGRLSAWQNWVFIRPNSTGEQGALKLFGSRASKARFNWERV